MTVRRHWIVLIAAAALLIRFTVPASAGEAPVPASPHPAMATAAGEVEAAHVHPPESKPEVVILLEWLLEQLPTAAPLFDKLQKDFNPIPREHYGPLLDWARGQSTVVLPIIFKIVCAVGEGQPLEEHALPLWVCNFLIDTLPGLVDTFWDLIVLFAPVVFELIGQFLPVILSFLINWLSGPRSAAVSSASEVIAAHVHSDETLPLIGQLLAWLTGQLTTLVPILLPILGDQSSALGKLIVDALAITAWLSGQLPTITPPIARLGCIIADDIIPPLLCSPLFSPFTPVVSGFIQNLITIVETWIRNLPNWVPGP